MRYHAFIFCSPGKPACYEEYRSAFKRLGHQKWLYIGTAGMSQAQAQAAVAKKAEAVKLAVRCRSLTIIQFSAGYGATRVLLEAGLEPDAILSVDSIHDRDSSLWNAHAQRIGDGFSVIHTDIVPPYRSTTDVAAELAVHGAKLWHVPGRDAAAHGRALNEAGPRVAREHVMPGLLSKFGSIPEPWRDPALSLGERAVQFSLEELELGNLETQGTNAGPRIREYFRLASREARNGRKPFGPGGLTQGNWCVVGACYAAQMSLLEGEKLPHEYPVSVIELKESAQLLGTFRDAEGYTPKPGDLCLRKRSGQWAGTGHVERVMKVEGDSYWTIGANEGTGWRVEKERLDERADIIGWIAYPEKRQEAKVFGWSGSSVPNDFTRWKDAMQEVDELLERLNSDDAD